MKPFAILLIVFIGFCRPFTFAQEITDNRQREVVFRNVNVIPMDREAVLKNQTVVVRNGKITAIGNPGAIKASPGALVIEATGKYLMPGLAEMHAHVPPVDDLEPMQEVLRLFLFNGITTIRGMLGHPRHLELREKLGSGEIMGPHFYTTGPSLNGQSVKTESQAAEMVRAQKKAGYDYLKLHPGLTRENFEAIQKTAKEEKIPFVGHVSFDVGVWRAIEAGYSSIDHLDGFVEGLVPDSKGLTEKEAGLFGMYIAPKARKEEIPRLMKALKEKNIWVVPTQALAERWFAPSPPEEFLQAPEMIYMSPKQREAWATSKRDLQASPQYDPARIEQLIRLRRQLIAECQKNGVGLLLGSDAPQVFNVPGFSTHQELEYMVASGLTPFQALQSGTVNVARYLNRSHDTGVIRAGAVSDLVLVNGNPLDDIRQTRQIEGVMRGNLWLPKPWLESSLKQLEKY